MSEDCKKGRVGPLKIFHLFMHIGHLLEDKCRSELAEYGLHHGQARVLMTLKRHGAVLQADLARGMDIAPPTLSLMLKKLLQQNLVKRSAVKGDERVYQISLTPAGEKAVEKIRSVWSNAETEIIGAFKEIDLELAHDELLRVRNAVGGRSPKL